MTVLEFAGDAWSAVVDAEHGGRLASFTVHDHELLVEAHEHPDSIAWGAYPMVPFAGRIRRGRLAFGGEVHELPANMEPHAIHGYGYTSAWAVVDDRTIQLELGAPWPFAARVSQTFRSEHDALSIEMTVQALEDQPVQLGWHPWFRRSNGAGELGVEFEPTAMYELDDEAIPTGALVDPPPGPWDNCFTGLHRNPVLRWGDVGVELSSTADHWVVYDEPTHAVCVEPQTGPPNRSNTDPRVVGPGERFGATMTYRVLTQ